jgi:hypothetical protein
MKLRRKESLKRYVYTLIIFVCIVSYFGCGGDKTPTGWGQIESGTEAHLPIPAGETVPLEVALVARPGIRGLVLDQITKTPLINVRVQLSDEVGNVLETPTTTSGVFEFKGVAANQKLTTASTLLMPNAVGQLGRRVWCCSQRTAV